MPSQHCICMCKKTKNNGSHWRWFPEAELQRLLLDYSVCHFRQFQLQLMSLMLTLILPVWVSAAHSLLIISSLMKRCVCELQCNLYFKMWDDILLFILFIFVIVWVKTITTTWREGVNRTAYVVRGLEVTLLTMIFVALSVPCHHALHPHLPISQQ